MEGCHDSSMDDLVFLERAVALEQQPEFLQAFLERAVALEQQPEFLQALGVELGCSCANEHVSAALAESLALAFPDACYLGVQRPFGPDGLICLQNMKVEGDCAVTVMHKDRTASGVCLQANGAAVSSSTRVDRMHSWLDLQYAKEVFDVTCLLVVPVVYDPEGVVLPYLHQAAQASTQKIYSELLETYQQLSDVAQCAGSLSLGFKEIRLALDSRNFSNLILLAGSLAPSFVVSLDQVVQDLSRVCSADGLQTRRLQTGGEFAVLDLTSLAVVDEELEEEEERKDSKQFNDGCRPIESRARDDSEFDKPPFTMSVDSSGDNLVVVEESEDSALSSPSVTPCHTDEAARPAISSLSQMQQHSGSYDIEVFETGKISTVGSSSYDEGSNWNFHNDDRVTCEADDVCLAHDSPTSTGADEEVVKGCRHHGSSAATTADHLSGASRQSCSASTVVDEQLGTSKCAMEAEGSRPVAENSDSAHGKPPQSHKQLTERTAPIVRQHKWFLHFLDGQLEQDYLGWRCSHLRLVDLVNNLAFVWFFQLGVRLPWHPAHDNLWLWAVAVGYLLVMFIHFWFRPLVWRRHRDTFYALAWLVDLVILIFCGVPKALTLLASDVLSAPRWFYYLSGTLPGCVWQLCRLTTFKKYVILQALTVALFFGKHNDLCTRCCAETYGQCRLQAALGIGVGGILLTTLSTYLYDRASRQAFLHARQPPQAT